MKLNIDILIIILINSRIKTDKKHTFFKNFTYLDSLFSKFKEENKIKA